MRQVNTKIVHTLSVKNFVLMFAAVQQLQQCKYDGGGGGNLPLCPLPEYVVKIPLPV